VVLWSLRLLLELEFRRLHTSFHAALSVASVLLDQLNEVVLRFIIAQKGLKDSNLVEGDVL